MIAIMAEPLLELFNTLPGREMRFAAGAAVFHIGSPVRVMHFVRAGCIHLMRYQADGSNLILQRAGGGAILAEASLYSARYHCDALAEEDSTTWAIARADLIKSLKQSPDLADAWQRHLAHEVQRTRLHAEILSLKTVAARLDAWIAWYGTIPEKGRWSSLSQQIGVSPEALYREFAKRRRSEKMSYKQRERIGPAIAETKSTYPVAGRRN
jgi:CRP-like cAMP-binding protein